MKTSVAGIAVKDGMVFVAKRHNVGQMGGRWEFPGGKVENDEAPQLALKREYLEEFNADVTVGKEIATASFVHNDETVQLIAYEITFNQEKIDWILTEHTEFTWVKLTQLPDDFVDSDLLLYPKIKDYYRCR